MKIPQLVQEIIDYYLYFAPWKNGIKEVNEEYNKKCQSIDDDTIYLNINCGDFIRCFYYNWRDYNWIDDYDHLVIYHPTDKSGERRVTVAELPPRYFYSNTKEQLKSLYF